MIALKIKSVKPIDTEGVHSRLGFPINVGISSETKFVLRSFSPPWLSAELLANSVLPLVLASESK